MSKEANMMNIYQLFVRLFGNKNKTFAFDADKSVNGCGTFNDVDDKALVALNDLGITHIWLTGVIRHSSMTSYPDINISASNALVTKGKAGSPYSIVDYYDIDPDLALHPHRRMEEFEALVSRIHEHKMQLIIDFVPNHLSREYHSLQKPFDIEDFAANDNKNVVFDRDNNFYYCPGQAFKVPSLSKHEDERYEEFPARASGNDVFGPSPSVNDWYDTVKLNYGIDYQYYTKHFEPIPNTWYKMLNIMAYWCEKGVDGFRVDMAEMVPVEFWQWAITILRESYDLVMIAEIYQPHLYRDYLYAGFDYLYDKVGLYNTLENICRHGLAADTISNVWKELAGLDDMMLRFMENHDEIRLASEHFMGDAYRALPYVAVAALMNRGPFMIYNGQESSEDAKGAAGFSGDDGRSSIFDYTAMPRHQAWMSDGSFSGEGFSSEQAVVFDFYRKLLNFRLSSNAISKGAFYDLMWVNPWYSNFDPQYVYAFLRFHEEERLLVIVNFHAHESRRCQVKIPADALNLMAMEQTDGIAEAVDVFTDEKIEYNLKEVDTQGIEIELRPSDIKILRL